MILPREPYVTSGCRDRAYLVAASWEAGDVGGEDEGQDAHVAEDVLAEVFRVDVDITASASLQQIT